MIASDNHGQIRRRRETENRTRDRPVATPPPNLILFSNRGAVTTSAFVFFSSKPWGEAAACSVQKKRHGFNDGERCRRALVIPIGLCLVMAIGYLGLHSGREAPCGESSADEMRRKGGGGSTDNWASMETIRNKKKMNGGNHTTMPVDIACASVQRPSGSIELRRAQRTIQSTARDAFVILSSRIGVLASRKWPCVCVLPPA